MVLFDPNRGLHLANSKIQCLEILLELANHTSADTVLDRILPYIVSALISNNFNMLLKT